MFCGPNWGHSNLLVFLIIIHGIINKLNTASKVSKYGFISGPYFPVFGLNTDQK